MLWVWVTAGLLSSPMLAWRLFTWKGQREVLKLQIRKAELELEKAEREAAKVRPVAPYRRSGGTDELRRIH